ncbi:TPA: hypothetical protein DIC20_04065 [Candidatus Dependentiae bacterium]|nr:MAG: hypothetical protein US03_C0004G0088 [candidate division TM6 bacterium GW2011_GWF2_36_131]KKQ03266.1 MAG: hypothetical protein US13_C0004G0088 [candidate division TM6 bacterium GW2011_GWE2_36_25]KKQ19188.1 MAG: hypothetical protein US32_C0014G0009 [candidate division TM6 bacterium GW2011_GWA2_36_9]HBR70306.1 hypothetical protein [Candidatus Dependentiae bacterium]HCU00851.1 hypothetical protein [Candidatus Dependentiae bacterium]
MKVFFYIFSLFISTNLIGVDCIAQKGESKKCNGTVGKCLSEGGHVTCENATSCEAMNGGTATCTGIVINDCSAKNEGIVSCTGTVKICQATDQGITTCPGNVKSCAAKDKGTVRCPSHVRCRKKSGGKCEKI